MREISSESYLKKIASPIECDLEDCLFDCFNKLADEFGFAGVDFDAFHGYFWDGYAGEFRHLAIELFERVGMDIADETGEEW